MWNNNNNSQWNYDKSRCSHPPTPRSHLWQTDVPEPGFCKPLQLAFTRRPPACMLVPAWGHLARRPTHLFEIDPCLRGNDVQRDLDAAHQRGKQVLHRVGRCEGGGEGSRVGGGSGGRGGEVCVRKGGKGAGGGAAGLAGASSAPCWRIACTSSLHEKPKGGELPPGTRRRRHVTPQHARPGRIPGTCMHTVCARSWLLRPQLCPLQSGCTRACRQRGPCHVIALGHPHCLGWWYVGLVSTCR